MYGRCLNAEIELLVRSDVKFSTWSTAIAQSWTSDNRAYRVISGPRSFRLGRLLTRVSFVARSADQLIVAVPAIGSDPRDIGQCDRINAALAALVVSRQIRWWRWRNRLVVYLQYPNHCQVLVESNLAETSRRVRTYFSRTDEKDLQPYVPTPVLSYLLDKSWLG